jgi:predicted DNA-binding transcriptional regulator AlpA
MLPVSGNAGNWLAAEAVTFFFNNVKGHMATKQFKDHTLIHSALQHFDELPDSAGARAPVVAVLFSISIPTVWRWSRDGTLPAPTKRGGVTLWRVGDLRAVMAAAGAGDSARTASATAAAAAKRNTAPAV